MKLSIFTSIILIYINFRTWKLNILDKMYSRIGIKSYLWLLFILDRICKFCGRDPNCIKLETDESLESVIFKIVRTSSSYSDIYCRYKWEWKYSSWNWRVFQTHFQSDDNLPKTIVLYAENNIRLYINLQDESYYFKNYRHKSEVKQIIFDNIKFPDEFLQFLY